MYKRQHLSQKRKDTKPNTDRQYGHTVTSTRLGVDYRSLLELYSKGMAKRQQTTRHMTQRVTAIPTTHAHNHIAINQEGTVGNTIENLVFRTRPIALSGNTGCVIHTSDSLLSQECNKDKAIALLHSRASFALETPGRNTWQVLPTSLHSQDYQSVPFRYL